MRKVYTLDAQQIYQVKANPNGRTFSKTGSAVLGCYKPETGISYLKEYSSKGSDLHSISTKSD